MDLDTRARSASADLLERAAQRPVPTVNEVVHPRLHRLLGRPPVAVAGVAAAVIILLVVAAASLAGRDEPLPIVDHPMIPLPVPPGVTPKVVDPPGLGVSVQLPESWQESVSRIGFEHAFRDSDDDAYFLSVRVATVDDIDTNGFAKLTRDLLDSIDADIDSIAATTVDGHDAVVTEGRVPESTKVEHEAVFTQIGIDLGDGTWAIVVVGEQQPVDQRAVREWAFSTIDVDAAPPWDPDLTHPATELAPPPGVEVREFAPTGLGVSIKVPATWTEPASTPSGFDEGIRAPNGPNAFVLARRVPVALGGPSNRERILVRDIGVRMIATSDELVDGYPARVLRYRIRQFPSDVLGVIDTEYVIDLGNGDFVLLVIGNAGGAPRELVEWIRSTIRVVE